MCGITGFIAKNRLEEKEALVEMANQIISRGPDDAGYYLDSEIGLAMRRLSIIGVENGKQPIFNETKNLILVYNGEIYNFQELKKDLIAQGHIFTTDTDSEVLVHGYEAYGTDLLNRLRGMFAFALWNKEDKSLFVARDMFGIKPLFYSTQNGEFVFGSEIKSIVKHPFIKKEFNEKALVNYLSFQYNVLEESFYKGIYQLLPGHYLIWKNGKVTKHRYWLPSYEISEYMPEEEAAKKLEEVLKDTVEKHKISDVEMGSFLSGGIDSSFLSATSELNQTFSVGFAWAQYNETEKAKELCKHCGLKNTEKIVSVEEYWDGVDKILKALDEPVADPSIIPLYYLCQLASKHVKVVISGEGADELFGGYNVYQTPLSLKPMQKIPKPIRVFTKNCLEKMPFSFKGKAYMIRAGQSIEERFIGNANVFQRNEVEKLLNFSCKGVKTPQEITAPFYEDVKDLDDITKMQYIDMNFWLRGDILRKSDNISMAHSLEVRVPYLDREVAKVAFSLPTNLRVRKSATKYLFRHVALKHLPKETAERRKLGFPVPLAQWLREDTYYNRVAAAFNSATAAKFFKKSELLHLLERHRSGKENFARKIWAIYLFLVWYDMNFTNTAAK